MLWKHITLVFLIGVLFIGSASLIINYYYYSWAGVLANKVGLCECKHIYVPGENSHPVNLGFLMDLDEVSLVLSADPAYEVKHDRTYLSISRVYENVRYSLIFDNYLNERRGNVTTLNMNLFPGKVGERQAEGYDKPTYTIKRRISEMIIDMPLSGDQKNEIISMTRVYCEIDFKMPLP